MEFTREEVLERLHNDGDVLKFGNVSLIGSTEAWILARHGVHQGMHACVSASIYYWMVGVSLRATLSWASDR
eukprot:6180166-Pleurochrysis_carterae.AAC.3